MACADYPRHASRSSPDSKENRRHFRKFFRLERGFRREVLADKLSFRRGASYRQDRLSLRARRRNPKSKKWLCTLFRPPLSLTCVPAGALALATWAGLYFSPLPPFVVEGKDFRFRPQRLTSTHSVSPEYLPASLTPVPRARVGRTHTKRRQVA